VLIGLENQSLNPMKVNMTLESEFVELGRIILLLVFLFSVLPKELNALSAGQRTDVMHPHSGPGRKRSVLYRVVLVIFGVETGIVLPSGGSMGRR